MTIKPRIFPYPVLAFGKDDYPQGRFDSQIDVILATEEMGTAVSFQTKIELDCEFLTDYLTSGQARIVLDIEASETLLRECRELRNDGLVSFGVGVLMGKVSVTPYILAVQDNDSFAPTGVHPEYFGQEFSIREADVLAIAPTQEFEIIRDESSDPDFMRVVLSADLDPNSYVIDVMGSPIQISAGVNVMKYWNLARSDSSAKPGLYQNMYKDCVLVALHALLREEVGPDIYWAKALSAKLQEFGLENLDTDSLDEMNEAALKILAKDGLLKMLRVLENA